MRFRVEPEGVTAAARSVEELGQACVRAVSYAEHTRPRAEGASALVRFLNATQDVEPKVVAFFSHLKAIAEASGVALDATAAHYRDTDAEVAARADALYGKVGR
jgi:hypothetical protein